MPAFVQELVSDTRGSFGVAASTSNIAIDGGAKTVTLGNYIVLYCSTDVTGVSAATDNLGNTYTLEFDEEYTLHSIKLSVFTALITSGGSLTQITVTHTTTADRLFFAAEFSGIASLAGHSANSGTSATPNSLGSAGDGLVLWAAAVIDSGNVAGTSFTPPSGFTDTITTRPASLRKLYCAHKVGTYTSGSLTGTIGASRDWVTAGSLLIPSASRPALAGISFDGVTVR